MRSLTVGWLGAPRVDPPPENLNWVDSINGTDQL
jgi:hypothetical protein